MGLFGPSGSEIEQTAKDMAEHSVKNGQPNEAGIDHAMLIGMRFVRFRKTGMFKTSSLCSRYKLNLIDLGVTNEEAEGLKRRLIITLQEQAKYRV
jgi:hypothetical protein